MKRNIVAAALAGLGLTLALSACDPTETADVVVIGGGNAGLAAAVSASEKGASVILIEKMPMLGGNSIRSGGAYNAVDPVLQPAQGIEDSVDKHFQQTYEGGDKKGDPALIRILVSQSLDGLKWLQSYGMKFNDKIGSVVGSLWPRTHQATAPAGTGYISTLSAVAKKNGVKIYLDTKATELIEKDGRVVGVKALDKDKKPVMYLAKRGVVMAAGGFAANVEMRMKYNPKLTAAIPTTNHPGATGDGIVMAEKVGADLVGMEYIQLLPICDKKSGALAGYITINIENVAFINHEGKRFIAEDSRRDVLTAAIFAQTNGEYYMVNDSSIVGERNEVGEKIEDLVAQGKILKGDTLADLAAKMGCEPATLEKTIADFNGVVANGNDPFGRKVFKNPIVKGPFYAVLRAPAVHHTMGGIKINEKTEVIAKDGKVIPGFYAAGEVTGGIHGTNRLGGNALVDTIVFGRIAGASAATAAPAKY